MSFEIFDVSFEAVVLVVDVAEEAVLPEKVNFIEEYLYFFYLSELLSADLALFGLFEEYFAVSGDDLEAVVEEAL